MYSKIKCKMIKVDKKFILHYSFVFLLGISFPLTCFICDNLRYMPLPSELIGGISLILAEIACFLILLGLLPGFLLVMIISLVSLFLVWHPKVGKIAITTLITTSVFCLSTISIFKVDYKTLRLKAVTENAKPLISALESYKRENKEYPKSLTMLVPKYISRVPNTGMCGYRDFDYEGYKTKFSLKVNMYEILKFDEFIYDPKNVIESYRRIGDWIYMPD